MKGPEGRRSLKPRAQALGRTEPWQQCRGPALAPAQRWFCKDDSALCTQANADAEYRYDGQGQRVQKILAPASANPTTITYVYDAFGKLAAEYSTAPPQTEGGTYYRTTDHLGSTRLVTDAQGGCKVWQDFYPFGERILGNASTGRESWTCYGGAGTDPFEQEFTAKERDDESGLDYFGARYLSASLGRFTTVDPSNAGAFLGNPQTWNGYSYTYNNPLTFTDPDGRCPWCLGAIIGAATDVAFQVAVEGKSLRDVDVGSVAISAAAGAAGVGLVSKLGKLRRVAETGLEVSESVASQLNETGSVSLTNTVVDVVVGKAGDRLTQKLLPAGQERKLLPARLLEDGPSVGQGKDFIQAQKRKRLELNKQQNGGVIRSDKSGDQLVPAQQSKRGVTPPDNEVQFDHVVPKSKGGTNSFSNMNVLSRKENNIKSDKLE